MHIHTTIPTRLKHITTTTITIAVTIIITLAGCTLATTTTATPQSDLLDVTLPSNIDNTIITYTGFTVSFNAKHHQPNYVAWELTADKTDGPIPRAKKFTTDTRIAGCATTDDYRNSGFDRGHMAPAADMRWDRRAMNDCFMLTNISPQRSELNSGSWKKLEEKCRLWAQRDSALIIICGPILNDRLTQTIGDTHITVPDRFFKIIYAPYVNPPRAIAFIMPNHKVPGGMQKAVVTIDQIEAITGFDFFATLDDELENTIESQANFTLWEHDKGYNYK